MHASCRIKLYEIKARRLRQRVAGRGHGGTDSPHHGTPGSRSAPPGDRARSRCTWSGGGAQDDA
ncbi:hypothetical protein GCM10009634_01700 [Saccharothrix xinjiangensis]